MKACSSTSDQFFLFAQDLRLRPELPEHVLGLLLLLLDVGLGLLLLQLRTPRVIEWPSDISRVLVVRIVYDALDGPRAGASGCKAIEASTLLSHVFHPCEVVDSCIERGGL